jgi:hypothetical protein
MSTKISAQMDRIIAGGNAAKTVGLPDNLTSNEVDADGMLPKETYWAVYISASWTDQRSFVGTCCQYADAKSAKAAYLMNAIEGQAFSGPYDGADWVSVSLVEPDGTWFGRQQGRMEVRK